MKQKVFWDIDSTIIDGNWDAPDIQVRPYFKELFLATYDVYDHILYTAANHIHAFHVCATLVRDWGIPPAYGKLLYDTALTRDNCPMIDKDGPPYKYTCVLNGETTTFKGVSIINEKCLDKACEILKCSIDDVYLHIDDHPDMSRWSRQDKRLWLPPYEGDVEDTVFFELLDQFKKTGQLKP
jgi:hypothetical protein